MIFLLGIANIEIGRIGQFGCHILSYDQSRPMVSIPSRLTYILTSIFSIYQVPLRITLFQAKHPLDNAIHYIITFNILEPKANTKQGVTQKQIQPAQVSQQFVHLPWATEGQQQPQQKQLQKQVPALLAFRTFLT